MIRWWSFEETFWNIDNFDGNFFDLFCFCCVNLWITDVSLLLRRWFVNDSLKIHFGNFDNFDENFLIFFVFTLLTSESLMFPCSFSDDSCMTLRRNIDDTTKIWMQTLVIIEVSNVMISRTLLFLCCFIDQSLMILSRTFDNNLLISMQKLMTNFLC